MADYYAKTRTNYFGVKDRDAFEHLVSCISSNDNAEMITQDNTDKVGFLVDGPVYGVFYVLPDNIKAILADDDLELDKEAVEELSAIKETGGIITPRTASMAEYDDADWDAFVKEIQRLLADGDACVITEVGSENFRYLSGYANIITSDKTDFINLAETALETAKALLGNPEWKTDMEY